jgi:hypothetical protein
MMRGASGDECGNLLGQEYNRPAEAGVLKKLREATLSLTLTLTLTLTLINIIILLLLFAIRR